MMKLETRCHCGAALVLYEPASWDNWAVHCPDCLDDAEDAPASASITGRGATPDDALQNWFDAREEAGAEPALVPSTIHTFVVPRSPEGFGLYVPRCPTPTSPIYYGPAQGQKAANQ